MYPLRCIKTYTWGSCAQGGREVWAGRRYEFSHILEDCLGNPSSQNFCRWMARHLLQALTGGPTTESCLGLDNQHTLKYLHQIFFFNLILKVCRYSGPDANLDQCSSQLWLLRSLSSLACRLLVREAPPETPTICIYCKADTLQCAEGVIKSDPFILVAFNFFWIAIMHVFSSFH